MIFHRANGSLGLGRRLHPGHQRSLGTGVQKAQDDGLLIGGDPNDGRHPPQLRRPRHVLAVPRLHRPVFAVEDQEIPPLVPQEFNQSRIGITDESPEDGLTGLQFGLGRILVQGSTPSDQFHLPGPFDDAGQLAFHPGLPTPTGRFSRWDLQAANPSSTARLPSRPVTGGGESSITDPTNAFISAR